MAFRPGATGMFLWAVDDGVTRRNGTVGRLMTTAWVAVGRSVFGSAGEPPGDCAPGAEREPEPGRGPPPGRAWTPGRGGIAPGRPGPAPRAAPPEPGRSPGPDPGRTAGGEPGRRPCAGGLEMICAGRNPGEEARRGGRGAAWGCAGDARVRATWGRVT